MKIPSKKNVYKSYMKSYYYRSDLNTMQFQLSFTIPKISAYAKYRSSGVLIMVQASGGGDYWGEYGNNKIQNLKQLF